MSHEYLRRSSHRAITAALTLWIALSACAQTGGVSADAWKEEVLLHDGQKIIVERSQTYGGRREIGQPLPEKEHTIRFTLPNSNRAISWTSEYGQELGRTNFNLLALHIKQGIPYLVAEPNLCLSYNKWGRPNPPYIFFRHDGQEWRRVQLSEIPIEFKGINLIVNNSRLPEIKDISQRTGYVASEAVAKINDSLRQPEYRSILREEMPKSYINDMCEERVLYKGHWVLPNDPVARRIIDLKQP